MNGVISMNFVGIDRVIFGSCDLLLAKRFFSDWGLSLVKQTAKHLVFETLSGSQVRVVHESSKDLPSKILDTQQFREVVYALENARDLESVRSNLARDRELRIDPEGTVHTTDDSGIHIGFCVAKKGGREQAKKLSTAKSATFNSPGKKPRKDQVANVFERANPFQMGHIVFNVPDTQVAERFYRKRLGFHLSDRYVGGAGVFLRWAQESEHHNLFFVKSRTGQTALHHIAFEVENIHEVFGGGVAFSKKNWPTEVGPGRHPISSAYFWYFKNPLGGAVEYFCDADYITPAWKPHQYRVNRFSEWHLVDGIGQKSDFKVRPSLAASREIDQIQLPKITLPRSSASTNLSKST